MEGEWIGFESEFGTSDGACRNVPDYQMPESLLDWGVVLTGYEHLTSTAVVDGKLKIRRTRLLPAVGCAIDSVPYDLYEKESEVGDDSTGAFFEDGSFSVGPHKLGQYNLSLSLSLSLSLTHTHTHCVHMPRLSGGTTQSLDTKPCTLLMNAHLRPRISSRRCRQRGPLDHMRDSRR